VVDDRTFKQKLNSRKLALAVGVLCSSSALLVGGYISGDNWVNVTSVIGGAYMATQAWLDRGKQ
jgi:hypothetical protein